MTESGCKSFYHFASLNSESGSFLFPLAWAVRFHSLNHCQKPPGTAFLPSQGAFISYIQPDTPVFGFPDIN